ncbi:hypothetical protein ACP4OV_015884 [Aristida adscensionis]
MRCPRLVPAPRPRRPPRVVPVPRPRRPPHSRRPVPAHIAARTLPPALPTVAPYAAAAAKPPVSRTRSPPSPPCAASPNHRSGAPELLAAAGPHHDAAEPLGGVDNLRLVPDDGALLGRERLEHAMETGVASRGGRWSAHGLPAGRPRHRRVARHRRPRRRFQEVVPLNAGNVFGAEDGRPALAWESLIRGALRRAQPSRPAKVRCYSHPPSPSRFDPAGDAAAAADELLPGGTDTKTDIDDHAPSSLPVRHAEPYVAGGTPRRLSRLNHFSVADDGEADKPQAGAPQRTLLRTMSRADRVGLVWPEQPLDLLPARTMAASSTSFKGAWMLLGFHADYA